MIAPYVLSRWGRMKNKVESMYLIYCNEFLTVSYFAEYYNLDLAKAERIVNIGRKLNHRKSK